MMCGVKESSNQYQSNHKQKIKREEEQTHQEMFTQCGPTWSTIDLSNPPMCSYKGDTKGL